MRKSLLILFLMVSCFFLNGQQPRPIEKISSSPVEVQTSKRIDQIKHYPLLQQRYKEGESLILDFPLKNLSTINPIIPFGFRLNVNSSIKFYTNGSSFLASDTIKMSNEYFKSVNYHYCDSILYGVKFLLKEGIKQNNILKLIENVFGSADFSNSKKAVFSDRDYSVILDLEKNKLDVYSLFHYPITESILPGVRQKIYYGPTEYEISENESIQLAFLNQESKENNVQSAFKVYYSGVNPLNFTSIEFVLDKKDSITFALKKEVLEEINGIFHEKDTRTFIFPDDLKKLINTNEIEVILVGDKEIRYRMPYFQKYSVFVTYEYYRWQATNALIKYRGI